LKKGSKLYMDMMFLFELLDSDRIYLKIHDGKFAKDGRGKVFIYIGYENGDTIINASCWMGPNEEFITNFEDINLLNNNSGQEKSIAQMIAQRAYAIFSKAEINSGTGFYLGKDRKTLPPQYNLYLPKTVYEQIRVEYEMSME
jgi:hypothetical protein